MRCASSLICAPARNRHLYGLHSKQVNKHVEVMTPSIALNGNRGPLIISAAQKLPFRNVQKAATRSGRISPKPAVD